MNQIEPTLQEDREPETVRMIGHVKWFDIAKGFGFIVPETVKSVSVDGDVMLHVSCLRTHGESLIDEGARIVCNIEKREKGWQVVHIIEMERSKLAKATNEAMVLETVTVKWFDAVKGFGFVNRIDGTEDIFLHITVLRRANIDHVEPGQRLDGFIVTGNKGLSVQTVRPI
ncbi:MAG: cold shock domain-containing protein [Pseudomonadota bacterium]